MLYAAHVNPTERGIRLINGLRRLYKKKKKKKRERRENDIFFNLDHTENVAKYS